MYLWDRTLDALWDIADLIASPEVTLNPPEAFIFGGAVLLHDLGMAVAAYPRGVDDLKNTEEWSDEVTQRYLDRYGRTPNPQEIQSPSPEIRPLVVSSILRLCHARRAQELTTISWPSRDSGEPYYLIADPEIRAYFGERIGRIAHSHWWPIEKLDTEFRDAVGAPPWCPSNWTVDPLKIACLLRVADAAHIDARRAPRFLWALRQTDRDADLHWRFQSKLNRPHLTGDSLVFTSSSAFRRTDYDAWWLCHDTVEMIDKELRDVDTLLEEGRRVRLRARKVAGASSSTHLARFVRTEGWTPVNTTLQVSDVPSLIQKLGGRALYGDDPTVPIRELIQNGADAIRARRVEDDLDSDWGKIAVRLGKDGADNWLEIEDNGIGMETEAITGCLLSFGPSYWSSSLMRQQHPGLLSKGLQTTGQFGIGFFSVFMLGNRVRVITRPYRKGREATSVLEFGAGLSQRASLRRAEAQEQLREGGTIVRIWIDSARGYGIPFLRGRTDRPRTLADLCECLAPAIDVSLFVEEAGRTKKVISANDWLSMSAREFLTRLFKVSNAGRKDEKQDPINQDLARTIVERNLEIIRDADGRVLGRACILELTKYRGDLPKGLTTVGGLGATSLRGILGMLLGSPSRAARDEAIPLLSGQRLADWATEQARLLEATLTSEAQLASASIVCALGGLPKNMKIALSRDGLLSMGEISEWCKEHKKVLILQDAALSILQRELGSIELCGNVLVTDVGRPGIWQGNQSRRSLWVDWPALEFSGDRRRWFHSRTAVGAIVKGLSLGWSCEEDAIWDNAEFERDEENPKPNRTIGYAGREVNHAVDILARPAVRPQDRSK